MKKNLLSPLFLGSLFCASVAFSQNAPSDLVKGRWLTHKDDGRNAVIEIYSCAGAADALCGKIVSLQAPTENGKPKVDHENPDEAKKSRPIMGLEILTGFKPDGEGSWTGGEIYNSVEGKTYSCNMSIEKGDPPVLNVHGYVGLPVFGKTQTWTRLKDGESAPWEKGESGDAASDKKETGGDD